jgi:hypothetical protein
MASFPEKPINNPSDNRLPGVRGVFAVLLEPPLVSRAPHFVHLSWLGESYVIRDFVEGVERKQADDLALVDIWRSAKVRIPCKGLLRRSIEDQSFWKDELQRLTEVYASASAPASSMSRTAPRPLGLAKGLGKIEPGFFDPLPPDLLAAFDGDGS